MQELLSFMAQYDSEEKCRQFLFQLRWPCGFICAYCGYDQYCMIHTRNLYQCTMCKQQQSLTSGTMLHNTKLPVSYWLFVFHWFMAGEDRSARKLSFLLQIHYRTALRMLNIVRQTMKAWSGGNPIVIEDCRWAIAEVKAAAGAEAVTLEEATALEETGSATMAENHTGTDDMIDAGVTAKIGGYEGCHAAFAIRTVGERREAVTGRTASREDVNEMENVIVKADVIVSEVTVKAELEAEATASESEYATEASAMPAVAGRLYYGSTDSKDVQCFIQVDGSPMRKDDARRSNNWRPRLLEAYRSAIVAEALRLAQSRARKEIAASYRNVRNWQPYYEEHHFRMAAGGAEAGKTAVSLLDRAIGWLYYAG